jgi:hypothetical protein
MGRSPAAKAGLSGQQTSMTMSQSTNDVQEVFASDFWPALVVLVVVVLGLMQGAICGARASLRSV